MSVATKLYEGPIWGADADGGPLDKRSLAWDVQRAAILAGNPNVECREDRGAGTISVWTAAAERATEPEVIVVPGGSGEGLTITLTDDEVDRIAQRVADVMEERAAAGPN